VFRTLIAEVLDLPQQRWSLIASIRSFDLRMGERFRKLFAGSPPSSKFADKTFASVRHLHIPLWSDSELTQVLANAPTIATAVEKGGKHLSDLARVPFNTRLLADLITNGAPPEAFDGVESQVQLLRLYWSNRVERHGRFAHCCSC
jgi:hypothetical protein